MILTLQNGQLKNQQGDTGYIADNFQFQFDNPPQTGAIYTSGFSVCGNGSLALGGSSVFYSCNSGGFNNLYDRSWAPQCSAIYINTLPGGSASPSGGASQAPDSQPQASTRAGVTQISDNQPQASTRAGVTQISDNQPQAPTSAGRVTQISDNQPQAPTSAGGAVTQISDNQPQAPTSAPGGTQISDHQPHAPTSAPRVTQISDNQPQAPTSAARVTQISDNQPQAPTQAGTPTPSRASASAVYTGAAAAPTGMANFALAGAAVVGAVFL